MYGKPLGRRRSKPQAWRRGGRGARRGERAPKSRAASSRTALKVAGIGVAAAGAAAAGRAVVRLLGVERSEKDGSRGFGYLEGRDYVNLTTFRRDGKAVTTPIWFAVVDGRLYATTPPDSGKMKRIRSNPRVVVTPSTSWGAPRGEGVEGIARDVENEETGRAEEALREKYRIGLGLIRAFEGGGMGQEIGRVILEVRPAEDAA